MAPLASSAGLVVMHFSMFLSLMSHTYITAQEFLSTMVSSACNSDGNDGVEIEFKASDDKDMQTDIIIGDSEKVL